MCISICLHVRVCSLCMPGARGGQFQDVGTPGTKTTESCEHRMGAGNRTGVSCKSNKRSQLPANAPFSPQPPGRSQSSILTFPETHMLSLEMRRISLNSSI